MSDNTDLLIAVSILRLKVGELEKMIKELDSRLTFIEDVLTNKERHTFGV